MTMTSVSTLLPLVDKQILRKCEMIESVIEQLKNIFAISLVGLLSSAINSKDPPLTCLYLILGDKILSPFLTIV